MQRISNTDKHRTLHVAQFTGTNEAIITYHPASFVQVLEYKAGPGATSIEPGKEIGRVRLELSKDFPQDMELKAGLSGSVELEFSDPENGHVAVLSELAMILAACQLVIAQLEKHVI